MKMADRCILSLLLLCLTVICRNGEAAESNNAVTAIRKFIPKVLSKVNSNK